LGGGGAGEGAAVERNFIGDAGAVGVGVAAQAQIEGAVGGERRGIAAAAVGQVGKGQRAGGRIGGVDDDLDAVADRGVAGGIGDHGAEHIVAVGEAALGGGGAGEGAAVERNFIGDAGAVGVGVAAQAQIEGAVGGDRRGIAAAAVGQVGKGQRAGGRIGGVDDDLDA